jgi:hypothetical protein
MKIAFKIVSKNHKCDMKNQKDVIYYHFLKLNDEK